jgi:hypothetical protein
MLWNQSRCHFKMIYIALFLKQNRAPPAFNKKHLTGYLLFLIKHINFFSEFYSLSISPWCFTHLSIRPICLYPIAKPRNVSGVFESVVMVTFQSNFHLKIHQNNIFYFLKFIFNINISKRSKNIKKT